MFDRISQIAIFVLGTLAVVLVARKNKYGFLAGLASQPFWFGTAIVNRQWGVIFFNVVATLSWTYGVYNWFFKKDDGEINRSIE